MAAPVVVPVNSLTISVPNSHPEALRLLAVAVPYRSLPPWVIMFSCLRSRLPCLLSVCAIGLPLAALALALRSNIAPAMIPSAIAQVSGGQRIFEDIRLGALSPNFVTVRGISGGELAVRTFTEQDTTQTGTCVGFIDRDPDHTLTLVNPFDYLSLEVRSPEDTTLVLIGPGGLWCSDDYRGRDPGLAGSWLAGTYQIWVGSYRKATYHPYVLEIRTEP